MEKPADFDARHELHEEVSSTIRRTASQLQSHLGQLAKNAGLSLPQYSVLRILAGAPDPLSCSGIAERMIARDPDITRLIDKLEKSGMVSRKRSDRDRRVVCSAITDRGHELVRQVDNGVSQLHRQVFGHVEDHQLKAIIERLQHLRLE